jgi:hypothetical protein
MKSIIRQFVWITAVACLLVSFVVQAGSKEEKGIKMQANLSSAQEVGVVNPGFVESAKITADFQKDLSTVNVELQIEGGDNVVAAHFHCALAGQNGPVVVGLFSGTDGPLQFDGYEARGTLTNADVTPSECGGRPVNNIASLAFAMREGLIYTNVHTTDNLPGEVRGQMHE